MGSSRVRLWIGVAVVWTTCGEVIAADVKGLRTDNIPSVLVTTRTKQVYRFHISGLHGNDAVRLAQQLWPVVSKLPAENPVHQTILDAKDRAGFIDDYRSLRNLFLEADVDTIYFLADEYWIESRSLPGTVAIPGDTDLRDRLHRKLKASGHDKWAAAIAQLQPSKQAPGWLVFGIGAAGGGQPSPAKKSLVDHAFKESCPIKPAAAYLGSLPALRIALNEATPLTVVNLERNKLDAVLTLLLTALVPSSAQTAKLSEKVAATTVAVGVYPCPHVRQVAHLKSAPEATALAEEVKKQINGAVQKVVDLDSELGPLLGLFAKSTVIVSAVGSDVHMIMKPPALFDLELAAIKTTSAQDLDWTALPPPAGYRWEVIASAGTTSRYDVFARVRGVRVRGKGEAIAPDDPAAEPATFRVSSTDSGLILSRNLKGELKIDVAKKGAKPTALPALELLDDRGRIAAVLRLDLGPGDPRYDLARTRAVLATRIAERTKAEQSAKKDVDDVENAHQRALLEKSTRGKRDAREEWDEKLRDVYREHGIQEAAVRVLHELDNQVRESQRDHPGATLVKDGGAPARGDAEWAVDRNKFPFAGQWLFDYGVLTLFQDATGSVAGVFATKVFHHTAKHEVDQTKPTSGSAILTGRADGSKLTFTMVDFRGRERTGKLVLDADGTGGTWSLESTSVEPRRANKASTRESSRPARRVTKDAEDDRSGPLDRIEFAAPNPSWTQGSPTASFAGYWVHPTDKRMNILFKSQSSGLLEGANGNLPGPTGNLRGAAAGNFLVLVEHASVGISSPSVREAVLSADGQKLTFVVPHDKSTGRDIGRGSKPLELTRDRNE